MKPPALGASVPESYLDGFLAGYNAGVRDGETLGECVERFRLEARALTPRAARRTRVRVPFASASAFVLAVAACVAWWASQR